MVVQYGRYRGHRGTAGRRRRSDSQAAGPVPEVRGIVGVKGCRNEGLVRRNGTFEFTGSLREANRPAAAHPAPAPCRPFARLHLTLADFPFLLAQLLARTKQLCTKSLHGRGRRSKSTVSRNDRAAALPMEPGHVLRG